MPPIVPASLRRYCTLSDTGTLPVFEALVPMIDSVYVPRGVEEAGRIVSVDPPPPFTDAGENVHDVFDGQPSTLKATVSLNPPDAVTVTAYVPDLPRLMLRLDGDAAIEKSGTGAAFTFSVTIVDCTGVPELSVAVIVTACGPVGTSAVVAIVSVDDPEPPVKVAGENVPPAPDGRPVTENVPPPL
jgi:hypothetical protein